MMLHCAAMDIIEISNLRLHARIGFSPHELDAPQDIVVNLRLGTDKRRAGESDDPADALNYKPIAKAVITLAETGQFALVEKLAESIACLATLEFGASYVEARIHKPGALRHADSVGICIQRRPEDYSRNIVFLSLGSNIAPEVNLPAAVALLRRWTVVLAVSPVYRSPPQGDAGQPHFLNMAVKAHTLREPIEFKRSVIDRIEKQLKRVRDPQNINASRTIDLDIALWNDEAFAYGGKPWRIPDPDITRYAHCALPLANLAPDYAHPLTGETLHEIAERLDTTGLQLVDLDLGRHGA